MIYQATFSFLSSSHHQVVLPSFVPSRLCLQLNTSVYAEERKKNWLKKGFLGLIEATCVQNKFLLPWMFTRLRPTCVAALTPAKIKIWKNVFPYWHFSKKDFTLNWWNTKVISMSFYPGPMIWPCNPAGTLRFQVWNLAYPSLKTQI